jgi:hypothetical protein
MDQTETLALNHFGESVLGITLIPLLSRCAVTVVKVLHFIDGVKVYVGCSTWALWELSIPCVIQLAGISSRTWTLTGSSSTANL